MPEVRAEFFKHFPIPAEAVKTTPTPKGRNNRKKKETEVPAASQETLSSSSKDIAPDVDVTSAAKKPRASTKLAELNSVPPKQRMGKGAVLVTKGPTQQQSLSGGLRVSADTLRKVLKENKNGKGLLKNETHYVESDSNPALSDVGGESDSDRSCIEELREVMRRNGIMESDPNAHPALVPP
uniref:Uncharacterized protein n=1 Tax=Chromera velia CCMP2878 TaxID=1169474 RepID=A0A0G4HI71_9ALVE|eukprot:Cvel_27815.t1-p1 / transcript=Cvel_27815.t1 / gene=Cvel_27815 / organism=Chromera_velia_CCMP2878 / gene_product=hypothetical protein / transcript_product=hypothetical protein / location=Cvel_scaffold3532:8759-9301(-) / protein_length=181 / sequence_SO=supercontig / SO=protein_coding / is_pseudo=false